MNYLSILSAVCKDHSMHCFDLANFNIFIYTLHIYFLIIVELNKKKNK